MCGIFGFIPRVPASRDSLVRVLEQGVEAIRHRGPDGTGTWIGSEGEVALGHVRLSIIDLQTGDQPMVSSDGRFVIVFNGEIYNYIELRDEIGPRNFGTASDTEVIIESWRKWGPACLSRLRGMFAFALWDNRTKQLYVARDRFGIKPFYWMETPAGFYFGSEMKALLPFIDEPEVDREGLSNYFALQFTLGHKTLLKDVSLLKSAHWGVVEGGRLKTTRQYWEVMYEVDFEHTERWFANRMEELLHASVDMHIRADVEVGAYVSGGVDSSLLAALARERKPGERFQGFNGRFLDDIAFDESQYAEELGRQSDMQMHVVDIGEDDFVDNIGKVIWHLDQPTAGPGSFPQYMVSREVGRNIKVVLGGQGGDEIFGGYARYLVAYFEQCIKAAIEGTLRDGNFVVTYESIIPNLETLRQYKPMLREFWAEGLFEERDARYWRLVNRSNTFGDLIDQQLLKTEQTFTEFREIFWGDNVGKESYFDSMTHFDFKTLLPALLQVEDRMSMAHGVEARVPFLDHPLVEFAATIPADIKFKNGELKRAIKEVFGHKLPAGIRNRKDKMGFPVPLNVWVKKGGRARDFVGDLLGSAKAQQRPYLKKGIAIDQILDGQGAFGRNLWALLSLELWYSQFVDRKAAG